MQHQPVAEHLHVDKSLCTQTEYPIIEDVRMKVESIENVKNVDIQLVFEPEWDKDMMSEEAKLELGLL